MTLIQFSGCKMLTVIIFLLILLIYYHNLFISLGHSHQRCNKTQATQTLAHKSETDLVTSKRIKRFLIFQGGGVVKLVLGTSFPIMMADKKRSLNNFYNFQMQYAPPIIPLYWWSFFNTTTFAARSSLRKRSMMHYDKSRTFIYEFMEAILERSGNAGKRCLLKVICELSRAPLIEDFSSNHYGFPQPNTKNNEEYEISDDYGRNIYHKLINAVFTPLYPNVHESYLNARAAGQKGANCDKTFGKCSIIEKWFRRFTQFL